MGVRRVVCGGCWFLLGFVGFLTVEKKDPYHWHEYSEISQTWMSLDEGCSSHHWNSILALSRKWYPAMTLNHTCWNGTLTRTLPISFHGIWLSLLNFDGKLNSPVLRCQRSPHLYSLLRKTESCAGSLQKGLVSSQTPFFPFQLISNYHDLGCTSWFYGTLFLESWALNSFFQQISQL